MTADKESLLNDQLEQMKSRLLAGGMSRRDVMRVAAAAAGGAAAVGLGLEAANAAPVAGPRAALSAAQSSGSDTEFYNDGMWDNPTSFDFNLNLYCNAPVESFSGLLTYDENLTAAPDWAERWETNEDASVWTFYIRPNNTGWSDGHPVTAHDFVWSYTRQLDPANGAAYAGFLFDIKNAQAFNLGTATTAASPVAEASPVTAADLGLLAIDDWTLQITTEGPRGYFPQVVAYTAAVPAPQWQVEKYGDKWSVDQNAVPIVTNGPFYPKSWDQGANIDLVKNPNHWDADSIKLDTIHMPIHPNANSVLEFESGSGQQQLDWTTLSSADYERYSADPDKASLIAPYVYPGIWMLLPQVTIAPFDNLQVRQALSHAIDRDRLSTVVKGLITPAYCMVPQGVFGYLDDPDLAKIQNFDVQKAMSLLDGTPYEGGKNWPAVTMYMRANEESYNADVLANDIVAQLKANIGLDIQIQAVPQTDFTAQLNELKWPLVFIRWWFDYPDANNGYGDMFYSRKSSGKRQAWSNSDFDDLVLQGKAEADATKRLAIYDQAEKIIQGDVGYIPLGYRTDMNVFKPFVKGVPVNASGYAVPDGNIYVRMLTKTYVSGRS